MSFPKKSLILVILSVILWTYPSYGKQCWKIFTPYVLRKMTKVYSGQDHLGHYWRDLKTEDYEGNKEHNFEGKFHDWLESNGSKESTKTRNEFVMKITFKDPIEIYRAVGGRYHISDKHHQMGAFYKFMDGKDFHVYTKLTKDYTGTNPSTGKKWTKSEMMEDLKENNLIAFRDNENPTYEDLRSLPNNPNDLPNAIERSTISLMIKSFDTSMKGNDFNPMFQIRFNKFLRSLNQPIKVVYRHPYHPNSIRNMKNDVLNSKEALDFMINDIRESNPQSRKDEVLNYLETRRKTAE